jgi:hypothetical protein
MPLWITRCSGTEVRALSPSPSHDEVHQTLDSVLDDHFRQGHRIRNVLRDNAPAWDVLDPAGAVLATYWISRGSRVSDPITQPS